MPDEDVADESTFSVDDEDPDNDSYNDRQNEVIFRKTRENIFKLLKNFMLLNS